MGPARDTTIPAGYIKSYSGDLFDIYTTIPTALNETKAESTAPRKIIENGVLYIERDGKRYALLGILLNE